MLVAVGTPLSPLRSVFGSFVFKFWLFSGALPFASHLHFWAESGTGVIWMQLFPLHGLGFRSFSLILGTLLASISIGDCRGLLTAADERVSAGTCWPLLLGT